MPAGEAGSFRLQTETMRLQRGFSTNDLVIIVTVLALMAVFAVPRYADINSEARAGSVVSLAANVESSARLSHKLWRASRYPDHLNIDGRIIELRNGYPTEYSIRHIIIRRDDFVYTNGLWTHKDKLDDDDCKVFYSPPADSKNGVQVISYTSGC